MIASGILVLKIIDKTLQVLVLDPSVQVFDRKPTENSYLLNFFFRFNFPNVLISFEVPFLSLVLLSVLLPLILVLAATSPMLCDIMCMLRDFIIIIEHLKG